MKPVTLQLKFFNTTSYQSDVTPKIKIAGIKTTFLKLNVA